MDNLTPEQRHKNMVSIRSKDTAIEVILRKALWHHGYRYRKNCTSLPGKPDIVITKYHIAIFCDSEFFHGKDWKKMKPQLAKSDNGAYWIKKIARNMDRDAKNEQMLCDQGWRVLRFWGRDILKHTDDCVKAVDDIVHEHTAMTDEQIDNGQFIEENDEGANSRK